MYRDIFVFTLQRIVGHPLISTMISLFAQQREGLSSTMPWSNDSQSERVARPE
jgi:hypothetical protein